MKIKPGALSAHDISVEWFSSRYTQRPSYIVIVSDPKTSYQSETLSIYLRKHLVLSTPVGELLCGPSAHALTRQRILDCDPIQEWPSEYALISRRFGLSATPFSVLAVVLRHLDTPKDPSYYEALRQSPALDHYISKAMASRILRDTNPIALQDMSDPMKLTFTWRGFVRRVVTRYESIAATRGRRDLIVPGVVLACKRFIEEILSEFQDVHIIFLDGQTRCNFRMVFGDSPGISYLEPSHLDTAVKLIEDVGST
jgi:hypothetical protein